MKFQKYGSIENSYREKTLYYIHSEGFADPEILWVATEKIHGANFSLWYDGKDFNCGKRSGFIGADNFYNVDRIRDTLRCYMEDLHYEIDRLCLGTEVVVYGELFGGLYPHPAVLKALDVSKQPIKSIQKGVFYHPDVNFIAFDLVIDEKIIDYTTFELLMKKTSIPYTKPLMIGTFNDVMTLNNVFESTIHANFGLPKIENNEAEGLVLKPVHPLFFGNDSRVILKNKNPKFGEEDNRNSSPKEHRDLNPVISEAFDIASSYITENRLRNVLSKYGLVESYKEFGKVLGAYSVDVQEELAKNHKIDLDKADTKILNKLINTKSGALIRTHFQNIIDGYF